MAGAFLRRGRPTGTISSPRRREKRLERSFFAAEMGGGLDAWPAAGGASESGLDCAGEACRYTARGRTVAIVTGAAGLPVRCSGLDAIVSQVPAGFRCRSMMPVIDRIDVWRRGAVALWLDQDGVSVESANESRGDRPWVPHPHPARLSPH